MMHLIGKFIDLKKQGEIDRQFVQCIHLKKLYWKTIFTNHQIVFPSCISLGSVNIYRKVGLYTPVDILQLNLDSTRVDVQ